MKSSFFKKFVAVASSGLIALSGLMADFGIRSFADGNYRLRLNVPDQQGVAVQDENYLNNAEYGVYLRYKVRPDGTLEDPVTGSTVQSPGEAGVVDDNFFTTAPKFATIKINGKRNISELSDPQSGTKNVPGIYVIRQEKRAPGYFLDKRLDGKYAQVEFPVIRDGKIADDQIIDIELKPQKAQKENFWFLTKRGPKVFSGPDARVEGIKFDLYLTGKPKKVGDNNEVLEWERLPQPQKLHELTVDSTGSLGIQNTFLGEGQYHLVETNGPEFGFDNIPQPLKFTLMMKDGKWKMNFPDAGSSIYLLGDGSKWVEDGRAGQGGFTAVNYPEVKLTKKIVFYHSKAEKPEWPTGKTSKATTSGDTLVTYEVRFNMPADWMRYDEIKLVDEALSGDIKLLAWYGVSAGPYPKLDFAESGRFNAHISASGNRYYKGWKNQSPAMTSIKPWFENSEQMEYPGAAGVLMGNGSWRKDRIKDTTDYNSGKFSITIGREEIKEMYNWKVLSKVESDQPLPVTPYIVLRFTTRIDLKDKDSVDQFENTAKLYLKKRDNLREYNWGQDAEMQADPSANVVPKELSSTATLQIARVTIKASKKDAKTKELLKEAQFKITEKQNDFSYHGTPLVTLTQYGSDEEIYETKNGVLEVNNLPYAPNGYNLWEVKAPDGYRLLTAPIEININQPLENFEKEEKMEDNPRIVIGGDDFEVLNVKKGENIVDTGTLDALPLASVGLALGLIWMFAKRKRF